MTPIRVIVVDDHPIVHKGVRLIFNRSDDVEVVGEAASGHEAIETTRRLLPDLILLDLRLPDMLPYDAIRRLRSVSPSTKIVIFTAHTSPTVVSEARSHHVDAFLGKDTSPSHFIETITRVAAGKIGTAYGRTPPLAEAAAKLGAPALTRREYDVLTRAAKGDTNNEIAHALFLAPTTIKSYLQSGLRKLGARNRAEAVARLSELELL